MDDIYIILSDSSHDDFQQLSAAMDAELQELNIQPNDTEELSTVFLAYDGETAVACGGFRKHNDYAAEIQRMYVLPSYRRQQLATEILNNLESLAKEMLFKYCLLETDKQQTEGIAFYSKHGYSPTANYSDNISVNAVCLRKSL